MTVQHSRPSLPLISFGKVPITAYLSRRNSRSEASDAVRGHSTSIEPQRQLYQVFTTHSRSESSDAVWSHSTSIELQRQLYRVFTTHSRSEASKLTDSLHDATILVRKHPMPFWGHSTWVELQRQLYRIFTTHSRSEVSNLRILFTTQLIRSLYSVPDAILLLYFPRQVSKLLSGASLGLRLISPRPTRLRFVYSRMMFFSQVRSMHTVISKHLILTSSLIFFRVLTHLLTCSRSSLTQDVPSPLLPIVRILSLILLVHRPRHVNSRTQSTLTTTHNRFPSLLQYAGNR